MAEIAPPRRTADEGPPRTAGEPRAPRSGRDETPRVSIVVPARDEAGNVAPLVAEVVHVMEKACFDYEVVLVDDASRDTTREEIRLEVATRPAVTGIALGVSPRAHRRGNGQSAALRAGLLAARGELLVTLDADLQNDPSDIPGLIGLLERTGADLVQGDRTAERCDGARRRLEARVGRVARRLVLGDTVRDTGCSLRVLRREVVSALPLELRGMHRFVPFCARLHGYVVVEAPVAHRPRRRGRSKYGTFSRGASAVRDLLALRWMRARISRVEAVPLTPSDDGGPLDG